MKNCTMRLMTNCVVTDIGDVYSVLKTDQITQVMTMQTQNMMTQQAIAKIDLKAIVFTSC